MRKLLLDGYVEDYAMYDENGNTTDIAPERLTKLLYGEDGSLGDDVEILLNSYGGSCNAATRMYDILKGYPGSVTVTISGTAASAATVFIQGADRVQMTPGSLLMIHDPATLAWGNEQDLRDTIRILQACKESIINMYKARSPLSREDISKLMSRTTWMDATEALERGFVDGIVGGGMQNRAESREHAEACVNAWLEKHGKPKACAQTAPQPAAAPVAPLDGARGAQDAENVETVMTDEQAEKATAPAEGAPVAEEPVEAPAADEAAENDVTEPEAENADRKVPAEEADDLEKTAEDEADESLQTLRDETAKWAAEMLAQMV